MASHVTTFLQSAGQTWPRAAVFDCDGLLVDTSDCWHSAYRQVAAANGRELNGFDLRRLDGVSTETAAATLSQALAVPISANAISAALGVALRNTRPPAMPGARALLDSLRAAHLPVAVASNAPAKAVTLALASAELDGFFQHTISAEDSGKYKPHPDVYRRACRALAIDPSDVIALEDSATGARSAQTAGLTVIAVPDSPDVRPHADLAVPRLDDPRVLELFGIYHVARWQSQRV